MRTIIYTLLTLSVLGMFCWSMVENVSAEEPTRVDMERFNRTTLFYQEGIKQYVDNNKFQGCSYLRLAIQESRWIGDKGQTELQIRPMYEKLCYSGK